MRVLVKAIFSISLLLIMLVSCSHTSQFSHKVDKNVYAGQLSDSAYGILKQFLTGATQTMLNDTIIIKYDYNNETCWSTLDQQKDEHIMGVVTRIQQHVQDLKLTRQNCSFFNFREPGNNLNKIKKWDNSIIIDSSKQLFSLLFNKRYTCGSSIIVLPGKSFLFLRNDPHSTAFNYTQQQIEALLK